MATIKIYDANNMELEKLATKYEMRKEEIIDLMFLYFEENEKEYKYFKNIYLEP